MARFAAIIAAVAFALDCWGAQASDDRIRNFNNHLANDAVSAIEVFSAGDTIATGDFHYDNANSPDADFSTYKLPFSHTFGSESNRLRPLIEGYLGYFDLSEDVTALGPPTGTLKVRSFTATLGGGVAWKVWDWLSVSPRMLVGYSHVWQEFDRNARAGDPFADLIFDWKGNALTLLPSLHVRPHCTIGRWDLGVSSTFTYLHVIGLHVNSPYISLGSDSQVWRNEISASYRSPWSLWHLPLRPFAAFARYDLGGAIRDAGFAEHFYEARLGLGVGVPKSLKPVEEVYVSGAYYFSGPFTGYSIGVGLGV